MVVEFAQGSYPDEQDFIVMGDLNADGSYYDEDGGSTLSGGEYYWVIDNSQDTTKSTIHLLFFIHRIISRFY